MFLRICNYKLVFKQVYNYNLYNQCDFKIFLNLIQGEFGSNFFRRNGILDFKDFIDKVLRNIEFIVKNYNTCSEIGMCGESWQR